MDPQSNKKLPRLPSAPVDSPQVLCCSQDENGEDEKKTNIKGDGQ